MATVTFKQGDTINSIITIKVDGSAIDITGGTVKFRIVAMDSTIQADALYDNDDVTITDAANGEATLAIARSVTKLWTPGDYRWEVEYIDGASNYSHTDTDILIIENSIYSED